MICRHSLRDAYQGQLYRAEPVNGALQSTDACMQNIDVPLLGTRAGQTLPLGVSCTTGKPLCAVSRSTWRSRCRGTRSCSTTTGDAITSVTCSSPGLISGPHACWQLAGHLASADNWLTLG